MPHPGAPIGTDMIALLLHVTTHGANDDDQWHADH
jgi:hypothetical protein